MKPLNPLTAPAMLQRWQWVVDPIGYMESAAAQHPDLFTADVIGFGDKLLFVNHPEAVQEILTNDRKKFPALSEPNKILEPLIGDYSVIMLEGDRHKQRRQLLMPSFHGERMRAYGQLICQLTETIFNRLPVGQVVSVREVTQEVSLQVILKAVFGVSEGERFQQLQQQLTSLADLFRSPLTSSLLFFSGLQQDWGSWSPWGKFLRDRDRTDKIIYAEISDRRHHPETDRIDILSLLMAARDEAGQPMTDQELRDELMTLLFAGYETTATAMAWALYWIHRHPQMREKLLLELDELGDSPDYTSLTRLPYLSAVCNETLRIHPVAMLTFPRVAHEHTELLGYPIEAGTVLVGCMYLIHQREDLYPQPKQFRPQRFLERQFSPYEFMPFGAGVRRCIGEALAMFEMKLVVATVLSHYKLELADQRPEIPRRRGVTLAPAKGVRMKITGRRKPAQILG